MADIPPDQLQFAQLAATQRFTAAENIKAAVDLYCRYEAAGGEQPSMARILVGKGWISRSQGALLLRHQLEGGPLPVQNDPAPPVALEELSSPAEVPADGIGSSGVGSSGLGLPPIQSSEFDIDD